jgi:hypothetical protein
MKVDCNFAAVDGRGADYPRVLSSCRLSQRLDLLLRFSSRQNDSRQWSPMVHARPQGILDLAFQAPRLRMILIRLIHWISP